MSSQLDILNADLIFETYQTMEALYERFNVPITPDTAARMLTEEVREFLQAADERALLDQLSDDANTGASYEELLDRERAKRQSVVMEAADVMFTLMGVLRAAGITTAPFKMAVDKVNKRNDAKTLDTHHVVAGKITRKVTP